MLPSDLQVAQVHADVRPTPACSCVRVNRECCSPPFLRRGYLPFVLAALLISLPGCAGYRLGHTSLYRPDICTVHVPVFQSESLRDRLGERLTEAVVKEIEMRTPYKVVCLEDADSVLSGAIVSDVKRVTAETVNDDARNITTEFQVHTRWVSRNGTTLMQSSETPFVSCDARVNANSAPPWDLRVSADSAFIPEAGQSLATAQQLAIERIARDIVSQMEIPW